MNTKNIIGTILAASASFAMAEGKVETTKKTVAPIAEPAAVAPYAIGVMKRASAFLASSKQFSVSAEIWQELEDENGNLLQFSKTVDLKLHRPNKLRVDVTRVTPKRSFFYNGKSLTVLDHQTGLFGQVDVPETTDKMIDKADSVFGISLPMEDILLSQPFKGGAKKAKSAQYLGKENILGVTCHHVAFQNDSINWQAWVDSGVLPVIRKIVITFKEESGEPRFTAIFNDWDFVTPLGDPVFEFNPPPGVFEIEVIKLATDK